MRYRFPSGAAFPRWSILQRRTRVRCLSETPGFHSNRIPWRISLVASGQAENKMANDVPLHLGGAGFDGISASAQVGVGPNPFIDRARVPAEELAVGAEQLLRDLLKALVEFAPENLLDRALWAGHARRGDAAEGPHLVEAHDLNLRAALRELLTDERVLGGRSAVALDGAREFDKTGNGTLEYKMEARAVRTALVH